jgi:hypothetical protein
MAVVQSQATTRSLDFGTFEPVPKRQQAVDRDARDGGVESNRSQNGPAQPRRHGLARRVSLTVAYDLWLGSWETALSALATATQSRTLGTTEGAAHKAVIAAERELVTKQFTLLLSHELSPRRVSITTAEERYMLDKQAPPTRNSEVHWP